VARTIAKDHGEKRTLILKTAAQVFATEGYDRASLTQVAQACSISKANIYHYYGSKDAILFAILETYLRSLRDRICGLALDGLTPHEKLRATISEILLAYEGADNEHKVQTMGLDPLPENEQRILKGYQRELIAFLSGIVRDVSPETFANSDEKLRSVTMSIFGMLNWFYMWNTDADHAARAEYADLMSKLTLSGIEGL
jgi:AcrR family transcriptional regulator